MPRAGRQSSCATEIAADKRILHCGGGRGRDDMAEQDAMSPPPTNDNGITQNMKRKKDVRAQQDIRVQQNVREQATSFPTSMAGGTVCGHGLHGHIAHCCSRKLYGVCSSHKPRRQHSVRTIHPATKTPGSRIIPKTIKRLFNASSPFLARAFVTHAHSNVCSQLFSSVLHFLPEKVKCPNVHIPLGPTYVRLVHTPIVAFHAHALLFFHLSYTHGQSSTVPLFAAWRTSFPSTSAAANITSRRTGAMMLSIFPSVLISSDASVNILKLTKQKCLIYKNHNHDKIY